METAWERRRILIWGKTRPELSKKYREIVCTGGVFEDTKRLVLYPIPLRYMDGENTFKKYQWIEAYVSKSASDPRPESYKIRADGISVLGWIPTEKGDWSKRAEWIINRNNIFRSIEEIQEKQRADNTSLGLIKPKEVLDVVSERLDEVERNAFWTTYRQALEQMDLPLDPDTGRVIKPLVPPDYRFKIRFRCDDPRCIAAHVFSILDWEIDALYFACKERANSGQKAARKVVDKIQNQICSEDKDLYFFTGNISTHQQIFTIVGLWWPKKQTNNAFSDQLQLFEAP